MTTNEKIKEGTRGQERTSDEETRKRDKRRKDEMT